MLSGGLDRMEWRGRLRLGVIRFVIVGVLVAVSRRGHVALTRRPAHRGLPGSDDAGDVITPGSARDAGAASGASLARGRGSAARAQLGRPVVVPQVAGGTGCLV